MPASREIAATIGRVLLASCMLVVLCTISARADDHQLVFLNWGEYMDPALLEAFERQTGIKVREVYFESDDHRDSLLAAMEAGSYDVILVSDGEVDPYTRRGWLAPRPQPPPRNLQYLDTTRAETLGVASEHAVPFFWGTVGIAYRSDLVPRPIESWSEFFSSTGDDKGRHGMLASVRELAGMALKSLGYSMNTSDRAQIREAVAVLRAHDHRVDNYIYAQLDETAPLVRGDVVAAMMYSGDALLLKAHNPAIEYVLPREGGQLWLDFLAVSASSQRKDNAWRFINFLCDPANSAQLTRFLSTATTNPAAKQYLPAEILGNQVIYPDEQSLSNSEMLKPLQPRALNTMNSLVIPLLDKGG